MSIATPAKCPSSFVQCCFTLSCFPPEFLFSAYIIINFWPVSPSHSLQILWITVIRASFSTIFWPSSFVHVTLFLFTAHILFKSEPACMWDSPIFFHQSLFLRHAIELYCLHCIASAVCYFVHSTLLKVECHEHSISGDSLQTLLDIIVCVEWSTNVTKYLIKYIVQNIILLWGYIFPKSTVYIARCR